MKIKKKPILIIVSLLMANATLFSKSNSSFERFNNNGKALIKINDSDNNLAKKSNYYNTIINDIFSKKRIHKTISDAILTRYFEVVPNKYSSSLIFKPTNNVGQGLKLTPFINTIAFNDSLLVSSNCNHIFKTQTIERHRIWLNLANENFPANQILIGYMTGATNGVDPGIDGLYFNDCQIALNSYLNNAEYIIQGRALPFTDEDIVPLTFKTTIAGNYTISIDQLDGLFLGNQNIYIKDKLTEITHDLKQSAYTFSTETGVFNSRFEIVYKLTPSQLSTTTLSFSENNVIVYKQNNFLKINTGTTIIKYVKVFDVNGKLLVEQNAINSNEFEIKDLKSNGAVLITQITSEQGDTIIKKVIY